MHDKNLLEVAVQYARENRNSLYVRMNEHHSDIMKRNKKKLQNLVDQNVPQVLGCLNITRGGVQMACFMRHVGWKAVC